VLFLSGYDNLRKVFTLPCKSVLLDRLKSVKCDDGILIDQLEQLARDIKAGIYGADCIMSLDEAQIKPGPKWDPGRECMIGDPTVPNSKKNGKPACKVLMIKLKGVKTGWEKIIAYFYSDGTTTAPMLKKVVLDVLEVTEKLGILVQAIVCDGPTTNIAMLNLLGIHLVSSLFSFLTVYYQLSFLKVITSKYME